LESVGRHIGAELLGVPVERLTVVRRNDLLHGLGHRWWRRRRRRNLVEVRVVVVARVARRGSRVWSTGEGELWYALVGGSLSAGHSDRWGFGALRPTAGDCRVPDGVHVGSL